MSVKIAFLRAASAYVAAGLLTIGIKGIPPKHEVRALKLVIEGTLRSSAAGGFNVDARDLMSIAGQGSNTGGVLKKLRVTYNDKVDAISLTPAEARVIAVYANGRDPFPEHFRTTPVVALNGNAGATTAFKLPVLIPFFDSTLDYPNAGCPSSAQLNRDGSEINLETDGAHVMTVGDGILPFANGNAQVVVSGIKLYATTSRVATEFFAPTQYMRTRAVTQQPDTEKGPFLEHFLCAEVDPANFEANNVANITIETDEVASPRNATPTELAQSFGASVYQDGVLPLDITKNQLSGPFTPGSGAAGTTGMTVTPLVWHDGSSRDDESEWNMVKDYRTIFFNTTAAGSPACTLLYWRTVPIDESKELIRTILAERGLADVSFDSLAVKGGPAAKMYKPRWFATA